MSNLPRFPSPSRTALAMDLIDPVFLASPIVANSALDERLGCTLIAKLETLNPIRSFKGRGAGLAMATLPTGTGQVVSASAGNFGQGVAYAAAQRGLQAVIFAADTVNPLKLAAMRRLGAQVILEGRDFDAAKIAGQAYAAANDLVYLEDGAAPEIAEGAGTIALELTRSGAACDMLLAPLGNGALATGMGAWMKAEQPSCQIIAVTAAGAPAMLSSWQSGVATQTASVETIADGIAIRVPVPYALACMSETVDEVVSVSDTSILQAMRLLHETLGIVVEPAGAVGVAALLEAPVRFRGARVATVLCGSNVTTTQMVAWLCPRTPGQES